MEKEEEKEEEKEVEIKRDGEKFLDDQNLKYS